MILKSLCISTFAILFTGCAVKKAEEPTEQTDHAGRNEKPDLRISIDNGSRVSAKDLPGKLLLILFQPDCDHCQREAEDIKRHISAFADYQLYFISSAPMDEVRRFAEEYKLREHANVHLATTSVTDILNTFGPIQAPSIYLHDEKGTLIQSFNGEVAIDVVLKYL
jgi:peroxiredoxin